MTREKQEEMRTTHAFKSTGTFGSYSRHKKRKPSRTPRQAMQGLKRMIR